LREFRKEDGVPGEDRGNVLDFDHDGWTAEAVRDGSMMITGRSPRGSRQVLFRIVKIRNAAVPGKPATAISDQGVEYLLVTLASN